VALKFLRRKEAAAYLKEKYGFSSERALAKAACVGGGPEFHRLGSRTVVYTHEALDRWVMNRLSPPLHSTSEGDALKASAVGAR
jgi:hypothetical protein